MQGGRHGPGLGMSDGLWSQVINRAGALLPEPALTPQRHSGATAGAGGLGRGYGARGREDGELLQGHHRG